MDELETSGSTLDQGEPVISFVGVMEAITAGETGVGVLGERYPVPAVRPTDFGVDGATGAVTGAAVIGVVEGGVPEVVIVLRLLARGFRSSLTDHRLNDI